MCQLFELSASTPTTLGEQGGRLVSASRGEGEKDDDGAMDLILGVMDEGYHLGSAVAALVVIAHTVYLGLDSADEVTSLVQKCLLLHFHVVRLRPGSGVLLEVAVWLLDMAFHLWFLLVDCTRVVSSLYFKSKPLQVLHCAILFLFHLQILRRYCMGIHVTVDNVIAADEANAQQQQQLQRQVQAQEVAEVPAVAAAAAVAARRVDVDAGESSLLPGSQSSATKLTSQSAPMAFSHDELSLDFTRVESESSSPACRCFRHHGIDGASSQADDLNACRLGCWSLDRSAHTESEGGPAANKTSLDAAMFIEGPPASTCLRRRKSAQLEPQLQPQQAS
ncbi:hypothetical protein HPB50_008808 [Hyalomma asiaticum]|uniref:Uncharacterized protein n=1 Tax=Hyalomma asiaticum TaxID=266040 RepID=A0ACB7T907_HYAAI|nr:hypothetical protein HPB50_008808 [Hyalomma asiaticum]